MCCHLIPSDHILGLSILLTFAISQSPWAAPQEDVLGQNSLAGGHQTLGAGRFVCWVALSSLLTAASSALET